MSSSEDDGIDDWKPTQDESDDDSEEEEDQGRHRVPKVAKKKRVKCVVLEGQMVSSSEDDGTEEEEEQVRKKVPKVAKKKTNQVCHMGKTDHELI